MLFGQDWWMNAVSVGKQWERHAGVPMLLRRRLGFRFVLMPQLTQLNDCPPTTDAHALDAAIRSLRLAYYYQHFPINSPLPAQLQQLGYTVRDRVTYRISDTSDLQAVRAAFNQNKRRQLKKAEPLQRFDTLNPEHFYHYHQEWLQQLGRKISYSLPFFLRLYDACLDHQAGRIIALRQPDGQVVAAAFVVWDQQTLYYLLPTYNPCFGNTGVGTRLVWESIVEAHDRGLIFDFEGSVDPGIAHHYQQFGSTAHTYQSVQRTFNPLFRLLLTLQQLRTKRNFT